MSRLNLGDTLITDTTLQTGAPGTPFKTGVRYNGHSVWCIVYSTSVTFTANTQTNQTLFTVDDVFGMVDMQGMLGGAVPFPLTDPYSLHGNLHFSISVVDGVRVGTVSVRVKNLDNTSYTQSVTVQLYYAKM